MAVSLTAAALREHLGLPDDAAGLATATRLHGVASAMISRYAPDAPDAISDEAMIRLAGYLRHSGIDVQPVRQLEMGDLRLDFGARMGRDPLRSSGAMQVLSPYKVRRAGAIG